MSIDYLSALTSSKTVVSLMRKYGMHVPTLCAPAVEEIGVTGTAFINGQINVEQNPRVQPRYARGMMSRPGDYALMFNTEPAVREPVVAISGLLRSAIYEPCKTGDPLVDELAARANERIQDILPDYLNDACSFIHLGFSVHEILWQYNSRGQVELSKLKFREQSTLDQWLLCDRNQALRGANFRTDANVSYTLLSGGRSPDTEKLLLLNTNAVGNNFEGSPATRVVIGIRMLKELVLNIYGLSYQRYGVPLLIGRNAGINDTEPEFRGSAQSEMQELMDCISAIDASIAPALYVPEGYTVESVQLNSQMPDPTNFLNYLDSQMDKAWSNSSASLNGSFGSYALASVMDDKFMRVAPKYADDVARALDYLMKLQILWNHPDPSMIRRMPRYSTRFQGTQDTSKWITDLTLAINAGAKNWPEAARNQVEASLGLPLGSLGGTILDKEGDE